MARLFSRYGWPAAGLMVMLAWLGGLLLWGKPESLTEFAAVTYWDWIVAIFAAGFVLMVLGSWLRLARSRARRRFGSAVIALGLLWLMYSVSYIHFGGICRAPGDACVVTWPSRLTGLAAGLAPVAVGWKIKTRRRAVRIEHGTSSVAV
jgi:hypothetical protein